MKIMNAKGYSFETTNRIDLIRGTSKLLSLRDGHECSGEEATKIFGQILCIFGEPMYISENMEDPFLYCIIAADANGKQFVLTIYHGKTGLSIGGNENIEGICDAALALKQYIKEAVTVDFEYIGYLNEGLTKIIMKIENGKVSYLASRKSKAKSVYDLGILRVLP